MLPNDDVSFQLWTSRDFPPLEDQLKTLKALGYTDVQPFHDQYDDPEGMRVLLDRYGLTAKTGHFNYSMITAELDRSIAAARLLGMTLLIAPYLQPDERPTTREGWIDIGKALQGYARRLADDGLDFAWHNHDFELIPLADGSFPIEHLLGDTLLWEPDVAWIARAGVDPVPWLERYAGRIPAVHIKDCAPEGTKLDEDGWADVGDGTIDWARVWPAAVAAGSQLMVVEHDNPSDYERNARRSIAAVRKMAGV